MERGEGWGHVTMQEEQSAVVRAVGRGWQRRRTLRRAMRALQRPHDRSADAIKARATRVAPGESRKEPAPLRSSQ